MKTFVAHLWYKCAIFGAYRSGNRDKKHSKLNNAWHCVEFQYLRARHFTETLLSNSIKKCCFFIIILLFHYFFTAWELPNLVVSFFCSIPFTKQSYQILPQKTRWWSFNKKTKLTIYSRISRNVLSETSTRLLSCATKNIIILKVIAALVLWQPALQCLVK